MPPNPDQSRPTPEGDRLFERVATAPISWGVCEVPGWGHQLSVDRVLSEKAALGFTHTELGSAGWLPDEPAALADALAVHGLSLLASFVPLVLHDETRAETTLEEARSAAELLGSAGARYFNTAPVTSADWQPRRELSAAEWRQTFEMLERLEAICAEHDLTQVVHEHVGCTIETKEEVDRLLAVTSTALVLDTGHLAVGGYDPLDLVRSNADRIGLVHLKDTSLDVAERLNAGSVTLMEAVQQGLFPALGQGDLPIDRVVDTLEAAGYAGWYVIEQDCALTDEPPTGGGPARDVAASIDYLRQRVGAFQPAVGVPSAGCQ
ncbi:MAG: sugar phosphate isomerase/epimerase [Acidimicrobiia bacterium]|nr:sugar phosphate isomerase/epimerase [Acidimicrobiia bacterium]